jgi:PKD repeat protein
MHLLERAITSGTGHRHARRSSNGGGPGLRRTVALLSALIAVAALQSGSPPRARADSAPADPTNPKTPPTVAIDRLPTVQHDGVAWQQTIVGNTVYVVGQFTAARPAGAAAGQNLTTRNNMLAYDLLTGSLKTAFNPNLNGQALAVTASPDGSRIYVGGDFTSVGGITRSRIAALDPTTGAMITSFNARADGSVKALAATATTVYVGGLFTQVNGISRARMAALRASDGALIPGFAPVFTGTSDSSPRVNAMVLSPTADRLVIGGNFITLNGVNHPGYGLGMINATTGASLPLQVNDVVRNAGKNSAILSLSTDGTSFYGTGYKFGSGGNFEGSFAGNWSNGAIRWLEDCHGDSYGVYPSSTAVYVVSHSHYCQNVGGFGETGQEAPMRATAFSKAVTGVISTNTETGYTNFAGQPSPSLLNFFPILVSGTASGQGQAAWAVAGSGSYVVYAGEFLSVNGTPQQGLVRLATREIAPNQQGPKASAAAFTPTLTSPVAGSVRVDWIADFDYDNSDLVYTVFRDSMPTPVTTIPRASTWWSRPPMTFTDSNLSAGLHTYKVRATDPFGNAHTSPPVSITIAGTGNAQPVASFTTAVNSATVSVNAGASTDSDGTIASYAWQWGDGQTGAGVTNSHAYAGAGTYTVTLIVTDNAGGQGSTSRTVTIGNPPAVLASDGFGRTVATGLGSADIGGAWSTNGSSYSVTGGEGVVSVAAAGQGPWAQLPGVTSTATDLTAAVRLDKLVDTGAAYLGTIGRRVGTSDYRLKLKVDPAGGVSISAIRSSGGETTLATLAVPGLTYVAGAQLKTRLQVTGTAPTTIRAKVWLSTATEPATWQVTATDSTAALQSAGSVGLFTFISGTSTNSPWVFRFDDVRAVPA